ncbi:hypothetical protein PsorP6_011015 [Peronosclerospora sorghi]|uniref:Uncharacterized protein n=1 Tax=Peronosclerospora sorghi TaxID=230839 RepID=A0ACC0VYG8_9STRA|nr:hypothetical protein PsorP6_011015 [Peronosclerospora sorghi]
MASSTCESFVANDGSDDTVVRFKWNGESIGLELMRSSPSTVEHLVQWGSDPLGVTLGVEETSRRIIVTRSSRSDVNIGDVVLQAGGEPMTEQNFTERLVLLKQEHELGETAIPFVFAPPPPPVIVKNCDGALKEAGVGPQFELRYVDGRVVRYLEMKELEILIRHSHKPCTMAFVQSKEKKLDKSAQRQRRKGHVVNQAAVTSVGLAFAAAIVVNIT